MTNPLRKSLPRIAEGRRNATVTQQGFAT